MQYIVEPIYANSYNFPGIDVNKTYVLAAMHTGMVLTEMGPTWSPIEQQTWTEGLNQRWRFEKVSGTNNPIYYRIFSMSKPGWVIDVAGQSTADKAKVITEQLYTSRYSQMWELGYLGQSMFWIKNRHSGKVLDIEGNATQAGSDLIQFPYHGGNNQKFRVSEPYDIVNAPTYKNKVTLYRDGYYQGPSIAVGLGSYNLVELGFGGQLSSLKIPQGLKVTLYKQTNYQGPTKSFTTDTDWVGDFNDQTNAILIELVATVYEHSNYGGRSQAIGLGNYDVGALSIGNDVISSIRVPVGMQVVLWEHAGYKGNSKIAMSDVPMLDGFNDKVSSLQVKMMGTVVPDEVLKFGDKIVLKSHHNKYLTANAAGAVRNSSTTITADAWVTIVRAGTTVNKHYLSYGDVVALKSSSNKYLTDRHTVVDATATTIGTWEKFVVVRSGETESRTFVAKGDMLTLRTEGIDYVRAMDNGNVDAVPTAIGAWEKWIVADWQEAPVVLSASTCGAQACAADACGADQSAVQVCGADACAAAACGAAASIVTVCGAAASIISICGLDVSGVQACGAQACGADACGANLCGADGCAAAACGADACGGAACGAAGCAAAACGAAACGADGCGANGCAAQACGGDACGAAGCAAQGCAADACGGAACGAATGCFTLACGANACAVDLCKTDFCAADACLIDLIPIIPGI